MSIWTVWSSFDRSEVTLVQGEGQPRFADGSMQPNSDKLLWRIEAATPEEASATHHLRMGWQPYRPFGEPAECLSCGAMFYPQGSGLCCCGHQTP
jgi:hypothetical protein